MDELLDRIAERTAKKITKNAMKKVSKIVYKAVLESVKEGWLSYKGIDDKDFCKNECTMWNTEYRCRECNRSEFDGQIVTDC